MRIKSSGSKYFEVGKVPDYGRNQKYHDVSCQVLWGQLEAKGQVRASKHECKTAAVRSSLLFRICISWEGADSWLKFVCFFFHCTANARQPTMTEQKNTIMGKSQVAISVKCSRNSTFFICRSLERNARSFRKIQLAVGSSYLELFIFSWPFRRLSNQADIENADGLMRIEAEFPLRRTLCKWREGEKEIKHSSSVLTQVSEFLLNVQSKVEALSPIFNLYRYITRLCFPVVNLVAPKSLENLFYRHRRSQNHPFFCPLSSRNEETLPSAHGST